MGLHKNITCFFILVAAVAAGAASAQNTGSIRGRVTDKASPVEYATISLFKPADSTTAISNTITDSSGSFSLVKLPFDTYLLKLQLIGYEPQQFNLVINNQNRDIDLGTIMLTATAGALNTVTVSSQKKIIQKTAQGLIVNAGASLTQLGGTATDLLRTTPTVVVDEEGAITLRGKPPLILINGRNSGISSTDLIPASSVDRIEIINNPSAQYDAEAESGIINIILKKNKQKGTNGALALGAGAGAKGRFNSAFMLNHKTASFNYALAYDNRFAGRTRNIEASRINYDLPEEYYLDQYREDDRLQQLQNLRLNIDFSPDAKNALSFEAIGTIEGQDNDESLTSTIRKQDNTFNSSYNRRSIEISREKVAEFALNYDRKFNNKRKAFSAGISTSFNNEEENTDITSQSITEKGQPSGDPFLQQTHNDEYTNVTNLKADYAFPVSARAVIETGYKGILRFLDADFETLDQVDGVFVPNPLASNTFIFNEQVHAGYIQYSSSAGDATNPRWKYDAGVRAEQVWNDGNSNNKTVTFSNSYFKLFPSFNIAYYNGTAEFWKMSYSRRINRPGLGQLNPFVDITDSLNRSGGNPYLQPELVQSFELGYSKDWQKASVYSVLYYRYGINSIRAFTQVDSNGVSFTSPANFGSITTYGIENIFTAKPARFYDFNLSLSFFRQNIQGDDSAYAVSNNVFSWYGKLINNFVPWRGSKLQVTAVYNAPVALPQGKRIAVYNIDLGFQQKIGKGNARLGLVVTDLFNMQQNGLSIQDSNFTYTRTAKVDSRAVLLTFAWTFGTSFKEKLLENTYSNE